MSFKNTPGKTRIVVCDELAPVALEVFRKRGFEPEIRTGMTEDELVEAVVGVDALVVRSATKITRRVFEASDRLKVVGRAGVGVDNVDCVAATERGVVVMNTPTGNSTTTAELAIALMCSLARHIPRANAIVRGGSWKKKNLVGTELTGKTLGVVGLGRIGRIVADRGLGLRMKVVGYDPYLQADSSPVAGVDLLELDELLKVCDFVSLHIPLTDSTRNLISWERISLMKKGARLINASRGGVVDEEAIVDALDEGRLAGAAFDVLADEPPTADHPLVSRDDVIVTPHLGASSTEAQLTVAIDVATQISDFLLEGVAMNAVNAPAMKPEVLHELAPFLLLAERLGRFLAQRIQGPIRKVEFTVGGDIAKHDLKHLKLAFLVGALRTNLTEGDVNFVNAPGLAKERGMRVLTSIEDAPIYRLGQIKVRASMRGGSLSHLVMGTVFGRELRFVRVDGVHLDLKPSGTILITRHRNEPGVVGMLGTILGEAGINIQRIELDPPNEEIDDLASGFLSLDDQPSPDVLEKISGLDVIEQAQVIRL
ncbi:MAG: D-3-phosphoglycerate dehydrogenase [Planctomycetota bacterium]